MLTKWRKNKFIKFLLGTILKIKKRVLWRWRVPVRYYIWSKFRINRTTGLEIVGGPKFCTDARANTHARTHTHRHAHTDTDTDTHTHTETQTRAHTQGGREISAILLTVAED